MPIQSKVLFPMCLAVVAPAYAQHGIDANDINKNGAACTDFFDYANGAWRSTHSIPDYMDRWSKRWESGEINKEHVRDILAEVSKKTDWPKGSAEQLSGDFYAACMDENRIDALGIKPLQPMLDEVRAIKTKSDLQRTIEHLHDIGIAAPFGLFAAQDLHNPTQMIAHVTAGGLGLPDRDYYLKPEKRFVDAREKYHTHVAKMFELAGANAATAKSDAETVFAFEKRLAEASLDNVALRDPAQQDHKTRFADLDKLAPSFGWAAYFDEGKMPHDDLNVTQPKFLQQVEKELKTTPIPQWRTYLEWQVLNASADALSAPFVAENFAFNKTLTGAKEMKPRWKRCAETTDNQLGEALGKKYVEKYFPPEAKARTQAMVKNILLAMGDVIRDLDWMSDTTKKKAQEKLASFNVKVGYPDKWKDYAGVTVSRDSYWDDVVSASRWNTDDGRKQVGKPVDRAPLGHDAADIERLLQSVPQRDRVPGRHPAAAGLRRERNRCGELRRHRRGDRPRDFARLRRRRFAVRRHRRAQQLVDRTGQTEIHGARAVRGQSVRQLFHRTEHPPQRQARARRIDRRSRRREDRVPRLQEIARRQRTRTDIDGFTPEQQFFIAWGQWRGDEIRPETQRTMVQGDPHPIAKYRVNGPLSNLPAFKEAFQCKADAAMVRPAADRCEVW